MIGAGDIVHGDCRDVLPGMGRARLLLSDPPYNIGFKYGVGGHKDRMPDNEYISMLRDMRKSADIVAVIQYPEETAKYITPALGVPDEVIAWCYNSNIGRRFRLVSIFGGKPDFSREKQPYKNPNDKRVRALIDAGSAGTNIYDWWGDIQLVKNVSAEKTEHPCPIPEALASRLIRILTNPGDRVIDPFCGGGTVPYVAKMLGRVGIGIEADERWFRIARDRFNGPQGEIIELGSSAVGDAK